MPWFPASHWLIGAVIILITAGIYSRTLDYPMVFDDRVYLLENSLFTEARSFAYPTHFVEFANEALKRHLDPDLSANLILRPVTYLTFFINHALDGFRPRWYRMFNISLHLANGVLVFAFLRLLIQQGQQTKALARGGAVFIAATSAIWFTLHPLATESVTYIVQRFTSFATFFYLLTLILHLSANLVSNTVRRRSLRVLTALVVIIGMLTKEIVFTAPLMAVFIDWIILGTPLRTALRRAALLLLCLPLIPAMVLLTAWAQNGKTFDWRASIQLANIKDRNNEHGEYAITQITVMVHYIRLILWPTGQSIDPDWPRYSSLLSWPVFRSLLIIGGMLGGSFLWQKRQHGDIRARLVFLGIAWFFGTVFVSSGLVPLPDFVAEHRSYLPSIGILVAAASLLHLLQSKLISKNKTDVFACFLVVIYSVCLAAGTLERSQVWSSRVRLWEDAAAKAPDKYRVWGNLGAAYAEVRDLEKAITCNDRARTLEPRFLNAYINLGALYNFMGKRERALAICVEAQKVEPLFAGHVDIRYNAAEAHLALGNIQHGIALLEEIVMERPQHRPSHVALAIVYNQLRQYRRAKSHLDHAAAISPLSEVNVKFRSALVSKLAQL